MDDKKTAAELVSSSWEFTPSSLSGAFTNEQLTTAAIMVTAKELQTVVFRLNSILCRLDNLGSDGLHDVIREMAREIKQKKRRLLARRKARKARVLKVVAT